MYTQVLIDVNITLSRRPSARSPPRAVAAGPVQHWGWGTTGGQRCIEVRQRPYPFARRGNNC